MKLRQLKMIIKNNLRKSEKNVLKKKVIKSKKKE